MLSFVFLYQYDLISFVQIVLIVQLYLLNFFIVNNLCKFGEFYLCNGDVFYCFGKFGISCFCGYICIGIKIFLLVCCKGKRYCQLVLYDIEIKIYNM